MSAPTTSGSCLLCAEALPDMDDPASGYNHVHVWARCYACPPCLQRYPDDASAMRPIRSIGAAMESERMARVRP